MDCLTSSPPRRIKRSASYYTLLMVAVCLGSGCQKAEEEKAKPEKTKQELLQIQEKEIQTCMQREGFKYIPYQASSIRLTSTKDSYGIVDSFHQFSDWAASDPNEKYIKTLEPGDLRRYWRAMNGDVGHDGNGRSVGGCTGSGIKKKEATIFRLSPEEIKGRRNRLRDNQERKLALVEWKKCMRDSGFTFTDPEGAINFTTKSLLAILENQNSQILSPEVLEKLRQTELATSSEDFRCRRSSNLSQIEEKILLK